MPITATSATIPYMPKRANLPRYSLTYISLKIAKIAVLILAFPITLFLFAYGCKLQQWVDQTSWEKRLRTLIEKNYSLEDLPDLSKHIPYLSRAYPKLVQSMYLALQGPWCREKIMIYRTTQYTTQYVLDILENNGKPSDYATLNQSLQQLISSRNPDYCYCVRQYVDACVRLAFQHVFDTMVIDIAKHFNIVDPTAMQEVEKYINSLGQQKSQCEKEIRVSQLYDIYTNYEPLQNIAYEKFKSVFLGVEDFLDLSKYRQCDAVLNFLKIEKNGNAENLYSFHLANIQNIVNSYSTV